MGKCGWSVRRFPVIEAYASDGTFGVTPEPHVRRSRPHRPPCGQASTYKYLQILNCFARRRCEWRATAMALRVLHVIVPREKTGDVVEALKEEGWEYSCISGVDNTLILVTASLEEMEDVVSTLNALGVGREYGSTYLTPVLASSPQPARERRLALERASKEEIMAVIERSGRLTGNYLLLTALGAVLAALGLLANNVAVIIGSMLVAPLMGPITGTAMGTVLSDRRLFEEGVKAEVIGIGISILIGILLTKVFPGAAPTPEILARAQPTIADFALAIVSGLAAAACLTGGIEAALVGVAIAAALMPPAANVGIGIGLGNPLISLGSAFLLLMNILSINLACTLMFWIQGIRPIAGRRRIVAARVLKRRIITVLLALLVLSLPIGLTTQGIYEQAKVTPVATMALYSQVLEAGGIVGNLNVAYDRVNKLTIIQAVVYSKTPLGTDFAKKVSVITTVVSEVPAVTVISSLQVNSISIALG